MDFEFTTSSLPSLAADSVKEPPDRGKGKYGEEVNGGKGPEKPEVVSFRDKVLGKQKLPLRERVDLVATNIVRIEHVNGSRLMPMLHVDKKMIEELSTPWKDALVVKILGKNLGFNVMKSRLGGVWKLAGDLDIMDVGNGFYMVMFDSDEDRNKVISGGPWMIFDHYLTVRLWTTKFNAEHAFIDKTLVRVRIPSPNVLFYDESFFVDTSLCNWKPCEG